eukprot:2446341-Rhodomonas_salina.1
MQVDTMLKSIDTNHDGQVDWEEFQNALELAELAELIGRSVSDLLCVSPQTANHAGMGRLRESLIWTWTFSSRPSSKAPSHSPVYRPRPSYQLGRLPLASTAAFLGLSPTAETRIGRSECLLAVDLKGVGEEENHICQRAHHLLAKVSVRLPPPAMHATRSRHRPRMTHTVPEAPRGKLS